MESWKSLLPLMEESRLSLKHPLEDISSLKILMGHFFPQWKFLIHTILHCLSPKKTAWEQFSINIATAIICLATNRTFNFSNLIFEAMGEGPTIPVESHPTPTSPPSSSTSPPSMQKTYVAEEAAPMPYESPLPRVHLLGSDEGSLSLNELTHIKRVKKLKQTIKTSQARRRAKVVISDAEEDEEDSSKQGRSLIKELDMDAGISLVPPHVADQGRFDDTQVSDQPEEQLGVFSATKVLADSAEQRRDVENVQTYTRRRRAVSTASDGVSTASELKKTKNQLKQERLSHEEAIRLQEQINEEERQRIARDAKIAKQLQEEYDSARQEKKLKIARIVQIKSKERFQTASPEGYDLLNLNLKTMIEPNEEDEIWRNQQDWNLISWKLHYFCRVHVILIDTGFVIHMMVEKKYPLLQDTLSKILSRRLEVDHQSEMSYELIRFVKSQIQQ
ncbi:hypothetical protein Tco_0099704 [Tanacetum coccineum]